MDESELRTIEQIQQLLIASADVSFKARGGDYQRYTHISRVIKRFGFRDGASAADIDFD